MFNDSFIYGNCVKQVDEKYRISLPKFTNVESNEELAIISENDRIKVVAISAINKCYIDIIENLNKCNSKDDIKRYLEYQESLLYSVIKTTTVDINKRINVRGIFDKGNEILLTGCMDGVILRKKQ